LKLILSRQQVDCVVRCIIKGTKVTAQFNNKLVPAQIIYICVDWHFICSIYLKYSSVLSNGHFSTHAISDSHLCSISHSLNLLLSFSLSLSSAFSPLCFYLSLFNIKGWWFCMMGIIEQTGLNKPCFSFGDSTQY